MQGLNRLRGFSEVTADYFIQAAEACMDGGLPQPGKAAYQTAVERGASQTQVQALLSKYPELGNQP